MFKFTLQDIQEYIDKSNDIITSLDIEKQKLIVIELEQRTNDPAFWDDFESANKVVKELKSAKTKIEDTDSIITLYNTVREDFLYYKEMDTEDLELEDLINTEYSQLICSFDEFSNKYHIVDENDRMNAVLQITAGAGGTEANDWAKMLYRMYYMWAEKNNYKFTVSFSSEGDKVGIKTVIINIEGENAYGKLKSETGVHRLVRVSPYNAQGKRMTSFAAVFVSPLINDDITVELDNAQLDFEYFRCSGSGGQNVNKVNSGVRARYNYIDEDTGESELILVANTETRDQPKNKENALRILKSIIYQKKLDKKLAKKKEIEDSKSDNGWGSQIRSYVFDDKRVKDHRTGYQTTDVDSVMNGNINAFIGAYANYIVKQTNDKN